MSYDHPPRPRATGRARRAIIRWVVAPGVALLAACGTGTTMPGQTPEDVRLRYPDIPAGAVDLQAQPLAAVSTPLSQIADRRRVVLKTDAEWADYWELFYSNISPTPQPTGIAFASEMVVVATSGTRPNGGYAIRIEGVFEANGEMLVAVLETSPGPGCMTIQALSAPAFAVRVSASASPVRFVERSEEAPCS